MALALKLLKKTLQQCGPRVQGVHVQKKHLLAFDGHGLALWANQRHFSAVRYQIKTALVPIPAQQQQPSH